MSVGRQPQDRSPHGPSCDSRWARACAPPAHVPSLCAWKRGHHLCVYSVVQAGLRIPVNAGQTRSTPARWGARMPSPSTSKEPSPADVSKPAACSALRVSRVRWHLRLCACVCECVCIGGGCCRCAGWGQLCAAVLNGGHARHSARGCTIHRRNSMNKSAPVGDQPLQRLQHALPKRNQRPRGRRGDVLD